MARCPTSTFSRRRLAASRDRPWCARRAARFGSAGKPLTSQQRQLRLGPRRAAKGGRPLPKAPAARAEAHLARRRLEKLSEGVGVFAFPTLSHAEAGVVQLAASRLANAVQHPFGPQRE